MINDEKCQQVRHQTLELLTWLGSATFSRYKVALLHDELEYAWHGAHLNELLIVREKAKHLFSNFALSS